MAMDLNRAIRNGELSGEELHVLLEEDLTTFIQVTYQATRFGESLIWNPYLSLIASRLEEVVRGTRGNLIITLPPRHLKSYCVSVALPAWILGRDPSKEILCVSYGQELAEDLARQSLDVMRCGPFRAAFGNILAASLQPLRSLRTRKGGIRRATSLEGVATGVGGDFIIFDDPQKPGETLSEAVRRSTNEAYERTFVARANHPVTARMIIVMQRLHEDDFVAHVQSLGGDWEVINLPAIAEEDQEIPYTTVFGPRVYRRKEGEALHPGRIPLPKLEEIRHSVGEPTWVTQFQQRPSPAGGGLVKIAAFRRYTEADLPRSFDRVVQSWDTANTVEEWSAYSVCTTWGVKGKHIYLLHVLRARMKFPQLRAAVLEQARLHDPEVVFIENHASGTQILQDLREQGYGKLRGVKPRSKGDKETRMINQTALIENGFVHIPAEAAWLDDYLHELEMFPRSKHWDQIDSTSQALDQINIWPGWTGMLEYARQEMEMAKAKEMGLFVLRPPAGVGRYICGGIEHLPREDGCFYLTRDQALGALRTYGWVVVQRPDP